MLSIFDSDRNKQDELLVMTAAGFCVDLLNPGDALSTHSSYQQNDRKSVLWCPFARSGSMNSRSQ